MSFVRPFKNGLGLGSQVCQILAVSYQNSIDHYIKEVLRCKYYERYMDDFIIICRTKEEATYVLEKIEKKYLEIGIALNKKKTQILKMTKGFTWLQDRVYLTNTGKVMCKPSKACIVRNRRKLKKLVRMYLKHEMTYENLRCFYSSHIGLLKKKNGYYAIRNFERLFNQLIGGQYERYA